MSRVSIAKGDNRRENIKKALKLIWKDIKKAIRSKKSKMLFVKVNAIDISFPLACTHIDALESVLDIFYNKFNEIIVGDNSFAFTKYKGDFYKAILNKFPKIRFSDLTEFESENIEFKTLRGMQTGRVSLLSRKAFTISLALPKTHDAFVYTGCMKNMFGCVIKNRNGLHAMRLYERMIFNKYVAGNLLKWHNLVNVINETKPDLCILDAYEGMEGDGPIMGTRVELGFAMCSLDGLALDRLASRICGLEYAPYLIMLPASNDTEIVKLGFNEINEISKKFKLHYSNKYQIKTELNTFIPLLDIRSGISLLRRSYRLKDKIIELLAERLGGKNAIC